MEEDELKIGETNLNIKEIQLFEEDNKYNCQIQIIKDYLNISLYNNNIRKYQGNIHISNIQYYLGIYNFNITEIFDVIYALDNNKFNIIKDINKYILKIEFMILNKKRYINIELDENIDKDNNYLDMINELKETIKEKDEQIRKLKEELNEYKSIFAYDDFDIKEKEPQHKLIDHIGFIFCSTVLKDGRFVTGGADNKIIIYNNKTFKPDIIIKEHKGEINCMIQLTSDDLASCSNDKTIIIFSINKSEYKVKQILTYHTDKVTDIIELKNHKLASCSLDKSVNIYNKFNDKYEKEFSISINESKRISYNGPIIQTKDNEICYYEESRNFSKDNSIYFINLSEKKIIEKINNITVSIYHSSLLMIKKDLLFISGKGEISVVNVNSYNVVWKKKLMSSSWINSVCMLNKDTILIGGENKRLEQWKIDFNDLEKSKKISEKKLQNEDTIFTISKLGNGKILTGGYDCIVKIW